MTTKVNICCQHLLSVQAAAVWTAAWVLLAEQQRDLKHRAEKVRMTCRKYEHSAEGECHAKRTNTQQKERE